METEILTGLPLWALHLFLAGLVYCRQSRKPSHRAFAVFVLAMVGWSVCVKMTYIQAVHPTGLIWGRLAFAFASLIGTSFAIFCQVFPDRGRPGMNRISRLFILIGTLMAAISLTPGVLVALGPSSTGGIRRHYGLLYPAFSAFIVGAFALWDLDADTAVAYCPGA